MAMGPTDAAAARAKPVQQGNRQPLGKSSAAPARASIRQLVMGRHPPDGDLGSFTSRGSSPNEVGYPGIALSRSTNQTGS